MSNPVVSLNELFEISGLLHSELFRCEDPLRLLGKNLNNWLNSFLTQIGAGKAPVIKGDISPYAHISGMVFIAEGAKVDPTAMIVGPCYIGPGAEVRHGAFIRGNVYVGKDCVVGHATEVKSSIFLDGAKAGHFAYVGDSLLGRNVNLGAGTKLANLKFRGDNVYVHHPKNNTRVDSGLRKLGALMGDESQTGCNAVLDPGVIMFPKTVVMSCHHFRGTLVKGVAR